MAPLDSDRTISIIKLVRFFGTLVGVAYCLKSTTMVTRNGTDEF